MQVTNMPAMRTVNRTSRDSPRAMVPVSALSSHSGPMPRKIRMPKMAPSTYSTLLTIPLSLRYLSRNGIFLEKIVQIKSTTFMITVRARPALPKPSLTRSIHHISGACPPGAMGMKKKMMPNADIRNNLAKAVP